MNTVVPSHIATPRASQKSEMPSYIHPVDLHVGSAIQRRRKMLGMSQTQLANALGVSFQQIQKYERGANRISASRLFDVSQHLEVPVSYFFHGFADAEPKGGSNGNLPTTVEDIALARDIAAITDAALRKNVVALIKALGADRR